MGSGGKFVHKNRWLHRVLDIRVAEASIPTNIPEWTQKNVGAWVGEGLAPPVFKSSEPERDRTAVRPPVPTNAPEWAGNE
mgnify:CR=1 FL=1